MKQTLVIVDMQPDFEEARREQTVQACAREIQAAAAVNNPVIFLEITHRKLRKLKPTLWCLLESACNTSWTVYRKSISDGSAQVKEACDRFGFPDESFRLAGIYIHSCDFDTACGLQVRFPWAKVQVVMDACSSPRSIYRFDDVWAPYRRAPWSIELLNEPAARTAWDINKLRLPHEVIFPSAIAIQALHTREMGIAPLGTKTNAEVEGLETFPLSLR